MLVDLWNYFRGYVIIEVTGFSVERFVNLAVHKGVYIWDIKYGSGKVTMKVSVKGFKLLKTCGKKTKCKFKIIEKKGYPFIAFKYRKRKIFWVGFVFFIAFLYFLSSFVWLIEVDGNERIEQEDILAFCEDYGLKIGGPKFKISKKELEQAMSNEFTDISFLNIGIKGTKATISMTETIPKQEIIDKDTPCDIIAKKDGVLVSVYTSAGTPVVREQDVVSKGELLVSGHITVSPEIDPEGIVNNYVHADAKVLAKYYYYMDFKVDKEYIQKQYTENIKHRYRFVLFGKEINLFKSSISYENYDRITERTQLKLGENYPLPIIIIKDVYREYIPITFERTMEQMQETASIMVTNRIIREFDFESDVFEKIIQYEETDSGLEINATIVTIEDIGEIVPIDLTAVIEENIENETEEENPDAVEE